MVTLPTSQAKLLQKQIPTILGILLLVLGLGVGIFFFSDGLGVFAPRAAPEETPRTVKITNVTDTSFSVSFLTDSATPGYVKYGATADDLKSRAGDDRDQLAGSIGEFTAHHITVRELDADTTYYFSLGTAGSTLYDNAGQAFSIKTAKTAGTPPPAKTIYGSVVTPSGSPAEGSIVYVTVPGAGQLSSLVKSSGSWAIPLSMARLTETGLFANVEDTTTVQIYVQGATASQTSELTTTVATAQPAATITLGNALAQTTETTSPTVMTPPDPSPAAELPALPLASPAASDSATITPTATPSATATNSGVLTTLPPVTDTVTSNRDSELASSFGEAEDEIIIVDLTEASTEVVTTTQPLIVGQAPAGVTISIEVHSDTQITQQVTADSSGSFELDISQLSQQLEPGEHTVTYSYVDPTTGKTVTKTKTFTVAGDATASIDTTDSFDTSSQIALADTTTKTTGTTSGTTSTKSATKTTPYSSGNPYPIGGTSTKSATSTSSATRSSQIATTSALPQTGSVGTTMALILGGIFFLAAGGWSFWTSREWQREYSQNSDNTL